MRHHKPPRQPPRQQQTRGREDIIQEIEEEEEDTTRLGLQLQQEVLKSFKVLESQWEKEETFQETFQEMQLISTACLDVKHSGTLEREEQKYHSAET